jgi:hypothetical protein
MKKTLFLTIVFCLVITVNTIAAVRQGEREFSIFANYIGFDFEHSGTEDAWGAGLSVGKFLSDQLQLGLQGITAWSNDVDLFAAGMNLKYHFMTESKIVPYLGGQVNYAYADNAENNDGVMWGPIAGIKFFTDECTSLFLEYQYQRYDGGIGSSIDDAHAVLLGISRKF